MTSPEVGFTRVEIEKPVTKLTSCDIYIPEVNVILEINGPAHYMNHKKGEPFVKIPKLINRHQLSGSTRIIEINSTDGEFFSSVLDPKNKI